MLEDYIGFDEMVLSIDNESSPIDCQVGKGRRFEERQDIEMEFDFPEWNAFDGFIHEVDYHAMVSEKSVSP
jgi:hypothetical protein